MRKLMQRETGEIYIFFLPCYKLTQCSFRVFRILFFLLFCEMIFIYERSLQFISKYEKKKFHQKAFTAFGRFEIQTLHVLLTQMHKSCVCTRIYIRGPDVQLRREKLVLLYHFLFVWSLSHIHTYYTSILLYRSEILSIYIYICCLYSSVFVFHIFLVFTHI